MTTPVPTGTPGSWVLDYAAAGRDLFSWPRSSEGGYNFSPGLVILDTAGDLVLSTTGVNGNNAAIESPCYWRYGFFETRIWVTGDSSKRILNWPAFWLLGE